ncbi:MAG: fatty acid desaturase, partial [Bdellovibrionota bacterium]
MMTSVPDQFHAQTGSTPEAVSVVAEAATEASDGGLKTVGYYRREIMGNLSPEVFAPNPGRLGWIAACVVVGALCFSAIAFLPLAWPLKLLAGVMIGLCTGTLGFVSHELLHGSVTKNTMLQEVLGFMGLTPYLVSPTYWKHSHNKLHHGKTQATIR